MSAAGLTFPYEDASDVSVIIAAHDAAGTLDATLASVAAQDAPPGEVVLVDDASQDATAQVARRWRSRLPLEVVTHRTNLGPSDARRTAIEASTRSVLTLLDADDFWLPDHLNSMRRTFRKHEGLVTADALNWMPGMGLGRVSHRMMRPIPVFSLQRTQILAANFVFVGSMFSRATYEYAGGFRPGLRGPEDWDLWIRMLRRGVSVTGPNHPTVLYRVHPAGLSKGAQQLENEFRMLEQAANETSSSDERAAGNQGLQTLGARLSLTRAYEQARSRQNSQARRFAAAALSGPWPVKVRAASLILAPGPSVRVRDKMAWLPSVRLDK